ncbi:hypothetical protein [uncultured Cetobacterium sp.]|uniref:hypothetical protein n=1 Tax=uncultured Cetobacterium sp. TaxID=527638 RepID=UPI00260A5F5A|nr:hypothetical protein [uncultured Cetobacterium sp.]
MGNGRMKFDQFDENEMDFATKGFVRGEKENRKKIPKMRKDFKEKEKEKVLNDKKKFYDFMTQDVDIEMA